MLFIIIPDSMKLQGLIISVFCMCLKGSSYVNKIQRRKENHIWYGKILEKLLDKDNNSWYYSTGENPLYKDRTISYKGEAQVSELSDLSHDVTQMPSGSKKSSKEGKDMFVYSF